MSRRRVRARRYGSYKAAKRIPLKIGGFSQRKLVRLRDNFEYTLNVTQAADGVSTGLGRNVCRYMCLNDVSDPQLLGHLTRVPQPGPGPNGESGDATYYTPPAYSTCKNAIVPLSTQFKDQYEKTTIIGCKTVIKICNNCHAFVPGPQPVVGSSTSVKENKKIWYAYRVDYHALGEPFPEPPNDNLTYDDIKESGKWTMGIINASANDSMASKTITINYSNKSWPQRMGAPGGPLDRNFALISDTSTTPASEKDIVQMQNHRVIVRMLIGPTPNYTTSNMPIGDGASTPARGMWERTNDGDYNINNVEIQCKTEYIMALSGLKAINGFNADGIVYPAPPTLSRHYMTKSGIVI